jgi:glycosyltransferase involved in cell wall biosynthesis
MLIVFLGSKGFPYGFAEIQKLTLIARSIAENNCEVIFINRYSIFYKNDNYNIKRYGVHENIKYYNVGPTLFKVKNKYLYHFSKLIGTLNELIALIWIRLLKKKIIIISNTRNFYLLLWYSLLSKVLNFNIFLTYVEFNSGKNESVDSKRKLFDNKAFSLVNGVFPISNYLEKHVREKNSLLPQLKIPVLVDFKKFENNEGQKGKKEINYFLFCGTTEYCDVIEFILYSFDSLNDNSFYLYLVINGNLSKINKIEQVAKALNKSRLIKIYTSLPYDELISMYKNSHALLIPLRPNLQDQARFPHKIGEYTASAKPIITTGVGEILNYFQDGKNALVAERYDINDFSKKMKYIIDFPDEAEKIGRNGYNTGLANFNYKIYGHKIIEFINSKNKK